MTQERTPEDHADFIAGLAQRLPDIFGNAKASQDDVLQAVAIYLAAELNVHDDADFAAVIAMFVRRMFSARKSCAKYRSSTETVN